MKNIVVAFFTILIVGISAWVASNGGAYNGGIQGKVTEDIGGRTAKQTDAQSTHENKDDREKETDQLKALRDKAGNVGGFKVSDEYKTKCSSCHGVDGSGEQNEKKLIGPKLFGQTAEEIYTKLGDFKSGRKENMIMKGLLIKMNTDDLRRFANEIGEFPARAEAVKK